MGEQSLEIRVNLPNSVNHNAFRIGDTKVYQLLKLTGFARGDGEIIVGE
jgi:hypothetical protein